MRDSLRESVSQETLSKRESLERLSQRECLLRDCLRESVSQSVSLLERVSLRESQILPFQRVTNFILKSPFPKSHEKSSFSKSHKSLFLSRTATHPDILSELLPKRQSLFCKTATPTRFFPKIVTSFLTRIATRLHNSSSPDDILIWGGYD